MSSNKHSTVKVLLTVLSTVSLLISNILAAKQMRLPFGITMTCGVLCFPVTYILSDVFSEVYGYRWSRLTCYIGFTMNALMVILFEAAIATPAPEYWENQKAFETVLGSTPRALIASIFAFIIGDYANDTVFERMRRKNCGLKGFGFRAVLSSLCGELIDSLIFIPIVFIRTMPFRDMAIMLITQVTLKTAYEVLILPVTIKTVKSVSKYEQGA